MTSTTDWRDDDRYAELCDLRDEMNDDYARVGYVEDQNRDYAEEAYNEFLMNGGDL